MSLECTVPAWFDIVNDWWLDNTIDTDTFYNALNWLLSNLLAHCKDITGLA